MSQEEENKNKALGCLAIIAIGLVIGIGSSIWDWAFGDDTETVDLIVYAEVNQNIINTLRLGGPECDMTGYDLDILDPDGRSIAGGNLGKGRIDQSGIFCGFIVRYEVPVMDEYSVFIPVHSGDTRIAAKSIPHEDAVQADGSLDIEVRWYNHRDAD